MSERQIRNAVIESARLNDGERGLLTAWVALKYEGGGQSFGGYSLYLPKDWSHHTMSINYAGHFIWRVMQIAVVDDWHKLPEKTVRADADHAHVHGIGHIINDDWFYPGQDFEDARARQEKA